MKGCKVVGRNIRKKKTAQERAQALRRRGHKARVGGSRGSYTVGDCGVKKSRRRRRRNRRR